MTFLLSLQYRRGGRRNRKHACLSVSEFACFPAARPDQRYWGGTGVQGVVAVDHPLVVARG
ncbi:MAG: hypothetical protein ACOCW2_02030 [Chitinivibrionales bacterium]